MYSTIGEKEWKRSIIFALALKSSLCRCLRKSSKGRISQKGKRKSTKWGKKIRRQGGKEAEIFFSCVRVLVPVQVILLGGQSGFFLMVGKMGNFKRQEKSFFFLPLKV